MSAACPKCGSATELFTGSATGTICTTCQHIVYAPTPGEVAAALEECAAVVAWLRDMYGPDDWNAREIEAGLHRPVAPGVVVLTAEDLGPFRVLKLLTEGKSEAPGISGAARLMALGEVGRVIDPLFDAIRNGIVNPALITNTHAAELYKSSSPPKPRRSDDD